MPEIIEEFEESQISCNSCKKPVTLKSFILKDTKPYRFVSYADCLNCGYRDTFEEDYQILDFGVKIMCNFSKSDLEVNLRRMAYIHKSAKVSFLSQDGEEIFTFSCFRSHVDCIEGIWMRGKEILEADAESSERCHKDLIASVERCLKADGFKMCVMDDSGYSKVCPYGVEYTAMEDKTFSELNEEDPEVIHERYEIEK